MNRLEKISINANHSITEALQAIDEGGIHVALVLNDDNQLIGTVSDGDVRRAILNGIPLSEAVSNIMSRKPITAKQSDSEETVKYIALKNTIHQVPIVDDDNHVVSIKLIEDFMLDEVKSNKVLLMVGGLGTRLRPLTDKTPKPMLKVGNKPILETILKQFKVHGFKDIILCVNYKSEVIEEYFGNGTDFGLNIEYIKEEKRMGTAGSLSLIKEKLTEPFFIMNGDLLTNINFNQLLKYHQDLSSDATMCVREYNFQVPFGVVEIHNDHNIKSVTEKPNHKFFVSAGIYMCNPSVLDHIPEDRFYDMPTLFQDVIAKGLNAVSFPVHEYWLDIGRVEEFEKANDEFNEVFGK